MAGVRSLAQERPHAVGAAKKEKEKKKKKNVECSATLKAYPVISFAYFQVSDNFSDK